MMTFIFAVLLGLGLHSDVKHAGDKVAARPGKADFAAFAVAHLEYKGRPAVSEWKGKI